MSYAGIREGNVLFLRPERITKFQSLELQRCNCNSKMGRLEWVFLKLM